MSGDSCWETEKRSFPEMGAPSTDLFHNGTANKKGRFPTGDSSEESSLKVGGQCQNNVIRTFNKTKNETRLNARLRIRKAKRHR